MSLIIGSDRIVLLRRSTRARPAPRRVRSDVGVFTQIRGVVNAGAGSTGYMKRFSLVLLNPDRCVQYISHSYFYVTSRRRGDVNYWGGGESSEADGKENTE